MNEREPRFHSRHPWYTRWFVQLVSIALLMLVGIAALTFGARMPPNTLPWRDPELDAAPRWFTLVQINRLSLSSKLCLRVLDASQLEYERVPDRPIKDGCGLEGGVVIQRSQIPYSSAFESSCAVAATLYWYERDLQELASKHRLPKIVRIDHLGSYSCRNVNREASGRRSQHARANAIDIAGFRFDDGSTVSVAKDWTGDSPQALFLKDAKRTACGYFNVVLGPDYNAFHADHFHLDLGPSRICR